MTGQIDSAWRRSILTSSTLVSCLLLFFLYSKFESANSNRENAEILLSIGEFATSRDYIDLYRKRARLESFLLEPLNWIGLGGKVEPIQHSDWVHAVFMTESYLREASANLEKSKSIKNMQMALHYSMKTGDINWIARAYDRLLHYCILKGNRKMCLESSREALQHIDLNDPGLFPLFTDHLQYELGMNFYLSGAYGNALPHLTAAAEEHKSAELIQAISRSHFFYAEELLLNRSSTNARSHYMKAMREFQSLEDFEFQAKSAAGVARTYDSIAGFAEVKHYLEIAIKIAPNADLYKEELSSRYIERAGHLQKDGKIKEARLAYQNAIDLSISSKQKAKACHGYALTYRIETNIDRRVALLMRANQLDPDSEEYVHSLGETYHEYALMFPVDTHFDSRVAILEYIVDKFPDSRKYRDSLGNTWLESARRSSSESSYLEAIRVLNVNESQRWYSERALMEAYNGLALIAWGNNHFSDARAYLKKAFEVNLGCQVCYRDWIADPGPPYLGLCSRPSIYSLARSSAAGLDNYHSPSTPSIEDLATKAGEWVGKQLIDPLNWIPVGRLLKWVRRVRRIR